MWKLLTKAAIAAAAVALPLTLTGTANAAVGAFPLPLPGPGLPDTGNTLPLPDLGDLGLPSLPLPGADQGLPVNTQKAGLQPTDLPPVDVPTVPDVPGIPGAGDLPLPLPGLDGLPLDSLPSLPLLPGLGELPGTGGGDLPAPIPVPQPAQ
jgi:hypothetical protein